MMNVIKIIMPMLHNFKCHKIKPPYHTLTTKLFHVTYFHCRLTGDNDDGYTGLSGRGSEWNVAGLRAQGSGVVDFGLSLCHRHCHSYSSHLHHRFLYHVIVQLMVFTTCSADVNATSF